MENLLTFHVQVMAWLPYVAAGAVVLSFLLSTLRVVR